MFSTPLSFPLPFAQQTRVYPYPLGAGSARPNPKMGAPDPENPLFLGFSVLRGGLRPWSQTMVSERARPWGRGRSGDCDLPLSDVISRRPIFQFWCAPGFATPPASYRTPELEFPKTAAETAGETAGETRGAEGTAAENCCGDFRFSAPQRKGSPAGSLRSSSLSTPSFPGSFPSSLRSSFGEFQLGGPVAGRGSRNPGCRIHAVEDREKVLNVKMIHYASWGPFFLGTPRNTDN